MIMAQDDPFDLQRFIAAQDAVFETVREELRAGRKRSHWMWFVFPQREGLGSSPMAQRYAIGSLDEARAFSPIRCSARACGNASISSTASKGARCWRFSAIRTR